MLAHWQLFAIELHQARRSFLASVAVMTKEALNDSIRPEPVPPRLPLAIARLLFKTKGSSLNQRRLIKTNGCAGAFLLPSTSS
ncbi:MAG: hypothetical protein Q8J78_07645, partial [Moraxellaceae bacterium]|nr:hypothetical protein [Moraxellaceae bacterium]